MKRLKTCLCTALLTACMALPFANDAMARIWVGATIGVPVGAAPAYYPYPAYYGAYPYYVPPPPGYVYAAPPPPYSIPAPAYVAPPAAYGAPAYAAPMAR